MKKYILYLIVPLMLMAACTSGPAEGSLYHRYADRKGLSVAEAASTIGMPTARGCRWPRSTASSCATRCASTW